MASAVAVEDENNVVAAVDYDGSVADIVVGNSRAEVADSMFERQWGCLGISLWLRIWHYH